ncbi:BMP family ABC transporter substrate-binding protein [uncultured Gemmiger sp.]|uniref:BMP family lipoprotein n=1 Tax=uncultured Gemmiger sp. TaxID=1623490 RepID=UPI0025DB0648|nr:BMP family ABC transporter substrate-binding protein [uncultured Gemmiger sp.]
MKKILALLMAGCMALSLVACGGTTSSTPGSTSGTTSGATEEAASTENTSNNKTDVAFVTDVGNIDDQSFNQYTWQGVQDFCAANNLKANYYRPSEDSDAARIEQVDNAVNDGAKAVVMAGYLFASTLETVQTKYPDVSFLALDVSTDDMLGAGGVDTSAADYDPAAIDMSQYITANTALVTYKEEQAGYLAGYAAVADGYTQLGFLGGIAVPAVIRYGYGFVQGADAAANELGIDGVNINYWYSGTFEANDEIVTKMDGWYTTGTEVIFACGGQVGNSCAAAAQTNNGKMIGVDVDQSNLGDFVITSAMKSLANSVTVALTDCMGNDWTWTDTYSGKQTVLGAAEDCVGLPMETSKFTNFTQDQYDSLFDAIKSGELVVDDSFDQNVHPEVTAVNVDYQG